jgi:hypothetical protein
MIEVRHLVRAAALTAALSTVSIVRAEESVNARARGHFKAGSAALAASDFQAARSHFQAAYELEKVPEIWVIVAEVEQRRANLRGALSDLQRYLELAPEGLLAATAQTRIEELETTLADEQARQPPSAAVQIAESKPSQSTPSPAPKPVPTVILPRAASTKAAPAALAATPAMKDRGGSLRLPAFVALGVGGLSASGAIATGLIASGRYNDPANCSTQCNDSHTISSKTLAVTSGILAGVAAAGVGVGVVLLLTNPAHAEQNSLVPKLRLRVSAERAAAGAVWTF